MVDHSSRVHFRRNRLPVYPVAVEKPKRCHSATRKLESRQWTSIEMNGLTSIRLIHETQFFGCATKRCDCKFPFCSSQLGEESGSDPGTHGLQNFWALGCFCHNLVEVFIHPSTITTFCSEHLGSGNGHSGCS